LQKPEEKGEDEDDGHGSQAAFAGGAVVFFVGAVLVEGVGVFFGGFVIWEHRGIF
jgi:hypothetical protein